MSEPKTALAVLDSGAFSLREVAFEHFEDFFQSVLDQAALSPEQQTALGEHLKAGIEKRDQLGSCIAWIDSQAEMLRAEEKRLASRRASFEKFSHCIRESLHQQMADWGVNKVEGLKFSFTLKTNPPRVNITDESLIPAEFVSYVPTISKSLIKNALDEGKQVPGAELIQGKRLEIK